MASLFSNKKYFDKPLSLIIGSLLFISSIILNIISSEIYLFIFSIFSFLKLVEIYILVNEDSFKTFEITCSKILELKRYDILSNGTVILLTECSSNNGIEL